MRNKTTKFIYLSLLVMFLVMVFLPGVSFAQTRAPAPPTGFELICPKYLDSEGKPVPADAQGRPPEGAVPAGIAPCIQRVYLFSLGAGALIALLMVVLAGYRYMTAGGNAEGVTSAKESLTSALTGLVIIFVAFILLYLINPDLVQFKPLTLPNLMPAEANTPGGFVPGGSGRSGGGASGSF